MNAFKLYITLLLAITATTISAQVPAAYQADYNRMMSNMASNMAMQNMLFRMNNYGSSYTFNLKYDYRVVMKDGTVLTVNSKIHPDTAAHANYLLLVDKSLKRNDPKREQKIYPSQTKEISRLKTISPFNPKGNQFPAKPDTSRLIGLATDSCWLFKLTPGKISSYYFLSESEMPDLMSPTAIQFGTNPVEKLTPEILEVYIKDDEKAYKAFLKKDYSKAIRQFNSH